jgi:hypothetical protein
MAAGKHGDNKWTLLFCSKTQCFVMKKKGNGQNQLMYRDTYRIVKQIS